MTVIPATQTLKAEPHALFYFFGRQHQADENGLLHDVPHDQAVILIANGTAKALVVDAQPEAPAEEAAPEVLGDTPVAPKKKKAKSEEDAA